MVHQSMLAVGEGGPQGVRAGQGCAPPPGAVQRRERALHPDVQAEATPGQGRVPGGHRQDVRRTRLIEHACTVH